MFSTRWHSFEDMRSDMNRLRQEMDRLFGRSVGNGGRSSAVFPALNVWEDAENLYAEAELPGLALEDLEIYVHGGNVLVIQGERKKPQLEGGVWHREERGYGSFSRSFELPYPVDADKVEAQFKQGILTVTMPKQEQAKPRRIEVKSN
jgi:HSP20 family protein